MPLPTLGVLQPAKRKAPDDDSKASSERAAKKAKAEQKSDTPVGETKVAKGKPKKKKKEKQRQAIVVLTIGDDAYNGKSSGQYGHAEMSALRTFILDQRRKGEDPQQVLKDKTVEKTVSCPNQPVCLSCSLILMELGFMEADAQTSFDDKSSGGVEWGANMEVKALMEAMGHGAVYRSALALGKKGELKSESVAVPIVPVANLAEASKRSWNADDRFRVANVGIFRMIRNHIGGSSTLTPGVDFVAYLQGG